MPKYIDATLVARLRDVAEEACDDIIEANDYMSDAVYSMTESLDEEARYVNDKPQTHWEQFTPNEAIESALTYGISRSKGFHKYLAKFDKRLAKMIELRLKLAEAADLPLNLTGVKVWARNEEYTL